MDADLMEIKTTFDSINAQAPRTQKLVLKSIYLFLQLCKKNHNERVNMIEEFTSMKNIFYKSIQTAEIEDLIQKLSHRERTHLKIGLQNHLDFIVDEIDSNPEFEILQNNIDVYLLERSIRLISV